MWDAARFSCGRLAVVKARNLGPARAPRWGMSPSLTCALPCLTPDRARTAYTTAFKARWPLADRRCLPYCQKRATPAKKMFGSPGLQTRPPQTIFPSACRAKP